MKRLSKILLSLTLIATTALSLQSCKKFLDVDSISEQSGNNYWLTTEDYDKYMLNIYWQYRGFTLMSGVMFFPAIGDFRCGPYLKNSEYSFRTYLDMLPTNDLIRLTTPGAVNPDYYSSSFRPLKNWAPFYRMIASCNIIIDQLNNEKIGMSSKKKNELLGEAVFMRNLCYFTIVRMYGDVPYSTEAYEANAQPREDMIKVINNCIADLSNVVTAMPWEPGDPSFKNIRAQKGAGLALLMHMNMWNAGFDIPNQANYYRVTDSLGGILMNQNNGAHELLPLEDFRLIFKGNSKEGLFEIPQSLNKNEPFSLFSTFADNFLKYPHKRYAGRPGEPKTAYTTFSGKFFTEMFPDGWSDKRKTMWYMQTDPSNSFTLECLKYSNIYAEEGEDVNPDDNQVIFRLADAILLRAEACAGYGKEDDAITYLNMIRARAGAPAYKDDERSGFSLSDAIWMERNVELIGEAHYFFDLVRTKRILDSKYTQHPMSAEAFSQRAWTWPLDPVVQNENPLVTLNNYWLR